MISYSKILIIPIVDVNLPTKMTSNSSNISFRDHAYSEYAKNVSPRYPKTKASTAYPSNEKATVVVCFD